MKKILALSGSNSSTSINYELVKYTVSLVDDFDIQLLNMANMPFPLFSEDDERKYGYKNSLVELKDDFTEADGIILSVNEHNSNPSAYFKNVVDWLSRLERKFLDDKYVFLMGTSAGKRGAKGAITVTENMLPRFGAKVENVFSLPEFDMNFSTKAGAITNPQLEKEHKAQLDDFLGKLITA
ncbi:NADPH-dependent FMN reductase [Galbibacter mesophilus]|uniref:NADPH-dependent FMN reductase n=1 Tax=Galbibacter mesophilus TaxID=379069 RepID=UPI00191FDCF4|nr:NAD(P)H-dependent oxidoreductase [Galbibacter mesophilus]MCM5662890.1 NAD(P)H-dependent oxidoreductase [Galbibacter mesophilus]